MVTMIGNVFRLWLGNKLIDSVSDYNDSYMRWAKTEYRNDWQYHYYRLIEEQNRQKEALEQEQKRQKEELKKLKKQKKKALIK